MTESEVAYPDICFVTSEEVTGHEMNQPLAELLALEAGDRAAAMRTFEQHAPERNKTATKGGHSLLESVLATSNCSLGSR